LSLIYWRLVRQRDDALARAGDAHALATQVLARVVHLRLADIDHHAAYVHDLCQVFGVTDWMLRPALQGLALDGMVHEIGEGQQSWVQLTLRGQQAAGL
jgi:hypothetical protein